MTTGLQTVGDVLQHFGVNEFGKQVEEAAAALPKVWRLMVFAAPDRLGGLLKRHGFKPTQKNRANWWRLFDPTRPGERQFAKRVVGDLKAAGLGFKWTEVTKAASQTVSAQILSIEVAAENRLARDALKLARERRRQAEQQAERKTYRKAESAVKRAQGEQ